MFTLVTDKSRFYRVKRGQSAAEIERTLKNPAGSEVFAGKIIVVHENLTVYSAAVGDTYKVIAQKFSTDEQLLKNINGGKPVYPTCKIFVPCKSVML